MEKINWDLLSKVINSTASKEEKKDFDKWLNENPNNKSIYNEIINYWEKPGNAYKNFNPNVDKAWGLFKIKIHKRTHLLKRIAGIAASILFIVGIAAYLIYNTNITNRNTTEYTSANKIEKIILSDGSEIWLNSNSKLIVSKQFNKKHRKVTMSGEAYFEVKPDPKKAFIIKTGKSSTQVLGTSFNIRAYPNENEIKVTVETGRVSFNPSRNKKYEEILSAGEICKYNKFDNNTKKSINTNLNYLSWKTGKFTFKNTPLTIVCEELSSFYKIKILLDSEIDKGNTLNGSFDNISLNDLLGIIDYTFDIEHYSKGDSIIFHQLK